jgi:PleD family two-component response regulator
VHQEQQPDLILLDIVMPEMDGFTACEKLKSNPLTQKIPVVFLTALNEVADETRGFKVGGADFIIKPFNPDICNGAHKHAHCPSSRAKKIKIAFTYSTSRKSHFRSYTKRKTHS